MLGTFAGVFTPSILTILGIILFLRTGYVVGNGGLVGALLIIAIATAVSILTSISLAAIATNIDVKGGGDYYLISRTLGLEFGGAIGVVLFLAQSVSIAFYAIGFGEATSAIAGWESRLVVQVIAAIAVLVLFAFAWAGADVATKLQFVVMVVLVAALVSFYIGSISAFDSQTLGDSWAAPTGAVGFWVAFAIFRVRIGCDIARRWCAALGARHRRWLGDEAHRRDRSTGRSRRHRCNTLLINGVAARCASHPSVDGFRSGVPSHWLVRRG